MVSVANELKKLADLKQAGVLTQDEFEEQKALILAQSRKNAVENLKESLTIIFPNELIDIEVAFS